MNKLVPKIAVIDVKMRAVFNDSFTERCHLKPIEHGRTIARTNKEEVDVVLSTLRMQ